MLHCCSKHHYNQWICTYWWSWIERTVHCRYALWHSAVKVVFHWQSVLFCFCGIIFELQTQNNNKYVCLENGWLSSGTPLIRGLVTPLMSCTHDVTEFCACLSWVPICGSELSQCNFAIVYSALWIQPFFCFSVPQIRHNLPQIPANFIISRCIFEIFCRNFPQEQSYSTVGCRRTGMPPILLAVVLIATESLIYCIIMLVQWDRKIMVSCTESWR